MTSVAHEQQRQRQRAHVVDHVTLDPARR